MSMRAVIGSLLRPGGRSRLRTLASGDAWPGMAALRKPNAGKYYARHLQTKTGDLASNSRFRRGLSAFELSLVDDFMHQSLLLRHHDGQSLGHARIGQAFD